MSEVAASRLSFWDLYSIAYDSVRYSIPYERLLDAVVAALPMTPGSRVLDLGCATGNLEERIGRSATCVEVVGVDASTRMLRVAKDKCASFPLVRFLEADLERPLPFADRSFDAVVLTNSLYALHNRAALITEVARVLQPGGVLVLSDPRPDARPSALLSAHFTEIALLPPRRRLAEYAKSAVVVPIAGTVMMLVNLLAIVGGERRGTYHFSSEEELRNLLFWAKIRTFSTGYGGQNWFVVAQCCKGAQSHGE